ncbi:acylneuraminate cytidylyltransferase [Dysgonomonas massiliensis]|uniref:acylneuraminate cytidylyltransferase n=1 Tax=Dysgonomonas massiliensis TaxID=2040292 RepID=UPI000C781ED5|nr:acylneuraminate cytidylyltransferase [Dysgonomonas massiliensis]
MSIIAFIPVRGGSKSIPLKNIKPLCGKPLVCWNIEALENTTQVDKIIVATDSEEIINTLHNFDYKKVEIYRRSAENATDTASTESVMFEYINKSNLKVDDLFMLVQATSPFTQASDFENGINKLKYTQSDSLLSCVRFKRFIWNEDGTSKNYDFKNRPRRQDFKGELLENGAFYISSVGNILESKNRLSGKIAIHEMPEFTALEIDEPDDWITAEALMQKHILQSDKKVSDVKNIKLFLTDVDGVLTDAGMYYTNSGDELKKFNTRDGMGLQLLQKEEIKVGIVTSEDTKIVENRAKKLKVDYLYQGKRDGGKLSAALEICKLENISIEEVAYIGDDVNCFELLSNVGFPACPADAVDKIKAIPYIRIMQKKGGEGAVREYVDYILTHK